jgi:hypothetical protein
MKNVLAMTAVVAAFSASAQSSKAAGWQREPDAVFGIRLGQALDDDLIPYCIDDEPPKPTQLPLCSEDPRDGRGITEISKLPIPEFGTGFISRHQGVVSSIVFSGSNDNYHHIKDVLVERYGRPNSTKLNTVQNKAGAAFKSEELAWRGARVSLVLEQRAGKVDDFMLTFTHIPSAKQAQRQSDGRTREASGKL